MLSKILKNIENPLAFFEKLSKNHPSPFEDLWSFGPMWQQILTVHIFFHIIPMALRFSQANIIGKLVKVIENK